MSKFTCQFTHTKIFNWLQFKNKCPKRLLTYSMTILDFLVENTLLFIICKLLSMFLVLVLIVWCTFRVRATINGWFVPFYQVSNFLTNDSLHLKTFCSKTICSPVFSLLRSGSVLPSSILSDCCNMWFSKNFDMMGKRKCSNKDTKKNKHNDLCIQVHSYSLSWSFYKTLTVFNYSNMKSHVSFWFLWFWFPFPFWLSSSLFAWLLTIWK